MLRARVGDQSPGNARNSMMRPQLHQPLVDNKLPRKITPLDLNENIRCPEDVDEALDEAMRLVILVPREKEVEGASVCPG
jgi:hypothetical protein